MMPKRGEIDVKAELTLKPDFTQSLPVPLNNYKSEIDSGGTNGGLSGENGFTNANGPVIQGQPKAFGQQQINVFGRQLPQLPLQESEFSSEPVQKQTSSQSIQSEQNQNRQPCATECQPQTSCFLRRCNQGVDPVFGIPTFAPPFFPLTFPTLPTLGFPTVAPFITHTYPTIAPPIAQPSLQPVSGYFDPSNSGRPISFSSLSYFPTADTKRNVNANGRLTQLSIAPITHTSTTPASNVISTEPSPTFSGKQPLFSGQYYIFPSLYVFISEY